MGPAIDTIATLDGPFDLVFIDADKAAYPDYYEAVLPKLAPRGPDRRRQHPVERSHPRPRPTPPRTPWPCAASTTRWLSTRGWWWSRPPSATASPSSGGAAGRRSPLTRHGDATCSTTTSISGPTPRATPRPPSSRWPPTASGRPRPGWPRSRSPSTSSASPRPRTCSAGSGTTCPATTLRPGMAAYWDHHARVDLDTYVEVVEAVKAEGLPVVLGLEVDYYQRPDGPRWPACSPAIPSTCCSARSTGSGPGGSTCSNEPLVLAEWDVRDIDAVWDEYTRAMEELGASGVCDVFAHPDLVKVAGRVPAVPDEFYDRITEAAVRSGMAAELSSAGWRKPVGEEYPAPPLLKRFVDRGVPLTTASDAHRLPDVADRADDLRGPPAREPGSTDCGATGGRTATRRRARRPAERPDDGHSGRAGLRAHQPRRRCSSATSSACSGPGASWPTCPSPTSCCWRPMAPVPATTPTRGLELVVLGQMRPSNSATVVEHDLVGQTADVDRVAPGRADLRVGRGHQGRDGARTRTTSRCGSTASRCAARAPRWPSWSASPPGPAVGPATSSAPTGTSSTASPSCSPSRPSRSRARRSPPRRRRGWATASCSSTRRARSATPRPTPLNALAPDGHVLTDRGSDASPTSGSRSRRSSGRSRRRCR